MSMNLTVCAGTDVGLVRAKNEDAFVVADLANNDLIGDTPIADLEIGERGVLLAVSDGMGGHKAGEVASALVVRSLRRTMANEHNLRLNDARIENAVRQANREVWVASHSPGRERMGATLTALYFHGPTAYYAEVGDSRAYLLRGGEMIQVTHDQSYVQVLVDSGALRPEDAADSPYKNLVLQAMGQGPDVRAAFGRIELREGDCFVLCSDGLTNSIESDEIRETVLGAASMDVACAALIERAKEHGGKDNITVILASVRGDLPAYAPQERISDSLRVLQEFDAHAA
jgi:serine/threonine protein phosphatase PrpC